MSCVYMRTTLGIVVVAAMLLVSCDKQLWPKLSDNPQPFVVVYDSLGMTLLLDSKHKLDRFWLQRSLTYIDSLNESIIHESTAIPLKGVFSLPFNTTYEEALTRFGEPNSYIYTLSDTGVFVMVDWDFEDRTSLRLLYMNDSLSGVDVDVQWALLPHGIAIGACMDTILYYFGEPSSAYEHKSWYIEPLKIMGIEIWLKSPHEVYESLHYNDKNLQLNFVENNRLNEWTLKYSNIQPVTTLQHDFDSTAIPNVGACGIYFNSSSDEIMKKFGKYYAYGLLKWDTFVTTYFVWQWDDSLRLTFELKNDSLRTIMCNVHWIELPEGIKIGDTKEDILRAYGKPSSAHKLGSIRSYKEIDVNDLQDN